MTTNRKYRYLKNTVKGKTISYLLFNIPFFNRFYPKHEKANLIEKAISPTKDIKYNYLSLTAKQMLIPCGTMTFDIVLMCLQKTSKNI